MSSSPVSRPSRGPCAPQPAGPGPAATARTSQAGGAAPPVAGPQAPLPARGAQGPCPPGTPPAAEARRCAAVSPLPRHQPPIWPAQVAIYDLLCATGGISNPRGNQPARIRQRGLTDGHRESRTATPPGTGTGCQQARLRGARPRPVSAVAGRDRAGWRPGSPCTGCRCGCTRSPCAAAVAAAASPPASFPGHGRSAANATAAGCSQARHDDGRAVGTVPAMTPAPGYRWPGLPAALPARHPPAAARIRAPGTARAPRAALAAGAGAAW